MKSKSMCSARVALGVAVFAVFGWFGAIIAHLRITTLAKRVAELEKHEL